MIFKMLSDISSFKKDPETITFATNCLYLLMPFLANSYIFLNDLYGFKTHNSQLIIHN